MTRTSEQDARYLDAAGVFGPALQRLARATEANEDRRCDLLQDMHVALWQSLAGFDGRCSLKTWVWRVAQNVAASHVGREARRNSGRMPLADAGDLPDTVSLSSLVEETDAARRLATWIRRLRPQDRQVMTLYLESLSGAEIADVTGLSPGAVATRISRLKAQLAHDFKGGTS
ncbi:MAG: RNA polymerase sigma factor [Hyphomonas sp.]|nr:RNA polymerase sigma factor [Hyphomonas sp.]